MFADHFIMRQFVLFFIIFLFLSTDIFSQSTNHDWQLNGFLSAYGESYFSNNLTPRRDDFTWRVSGNPTLTYKNFSLPVYFLAGSYENVSRQMFNRIGISPHYKWITVHLGYRSVEFSPLVVSQVYFLGAGVELNPSIIRLGFIRGRILRPVPISALPNNQPSYERNGYAVKFGLGTKENFVDLIFFNGRDDTNSIAGDTVYNPLVKPQENVALGISSKLRIKKNIFFQVDGGASLRSRDLHNSIIDDNGEIPDQFNSIYILRASSLFNTAIKSRIEYRDTKYNFGFEYHRIDQDYTTLAINYMRTDLQRFGLFVKQNFLKNRLKIHVKTDWEHNNLRHNKISETQRNNNMLHALYRMNRSLIFNFSFLNSNMNTSVNEVYSTYVVSSKQRNHIVSLNTNYIFPRQTKYTQVANVGFSITDSKIRAQELNPAVQKSNSFNLSSNYSLTIADLELMIHGGFDFGSSAYHSGASVFNTNYRHPHAGVQKMFLEKKLTASLLTSVYFNRAGGALINTVWRGNLAAAYKIFQSTSLQLRLSQMLNHPASAMLPNSAEFIISAELRVGL